MLAFRGCFGFRGIMLRILGFRVSGGILPGTSLPMTGGGSGMSSRFFGMGCGLGIRGPCAVRLRGVGIRCIPFILRLPMSVGSGLFLMSGLLGRRSGWGVLPIECWTLPPMGGRCVGARRFFSTLGRSGLGFRSCRLLRKRLLFMGTAGFR
jgi:hypothetical protein